MQDYHERLTISTPEAVDVVLDLAGPGTRISSGFIDLAIQVLVGLVGLVALYGLSDPLGDEWTTVIGSIGAFLLIFFYDLAWELLNDGRTPGKALLGLRVVQDDGRRINGGSSALRNLLRIVELPLFYVPGIVLVIATDRHQRLGDLVAGTLVVREPRRTATALGTAAPGGAEDRADPGILRLDTTALTDHDRSTARAYADRHRSLDPAERHDLARAIAAGLRLRLGALPPDLNDEQVVLEVARLASRR